MDDDEEDLWLATSEKAGTLLNPTLVKFKPGKTCTRMSVCRFGRERR